MESAMLLTERVLHNYNHWDDFDLLYNATCKRTLIVQRNRIREQTLTAAQDTSDDEAAALVPYVDKEEEEEDKRSQSERDDQYNLDLLEIFTYKQITQEKLWFTTKHEKLNIFSSSRTIGKLPYTLPITMLLGHNEKYVVYLGSSTNPNKSDGRPESDVTSIDWPAWPSAEVLDQWQYVGFDDTLAEYTATQGSRGSAVAQLFHTADLVAMEDSIKQLSAVVPLENHPRYQSFLKSLAARIENSPKPQLYRHGRLFVGRFAPSDTELINTVEHWNIDVLHRLSFHVQAATIPDQSVFTNLFVTLDNRKLCVWNLQVAEWGPLATCEFDTNACSTKAASEIVVTPEYIAILNPDKRVTIVPFSGRLFRHIDRRLNPAYAGNNKPFKMLADVDEYLHYSSSALISKSLSSTFYMPTANTLGVNASNAEILYVGTIHGYIHELHVARLFPSHPKGQRMGDTQKCRVYDAVDMDESPIRGCWKALTHPQVKIRIVHKYTFCTTMATPVYHIQGRGQRVLCSTSHNVFVFNELKLNTSAEDMNPNARTTLRIETGDGRSMNIRNAKFMGNLIAIETYNRHLLLIHSARAQQRVVPSSLGARQAGDPAAESMQQQLRDYMGSIMYWDNNKGAIRMAYDNLNSESWQVPVYDYEQYYRNKQQQQQQPRKLK